MYMQSLHHNNELIQEQHPNEHNPMFQQKRSPFLTGAQDIHLQRVTIPEAAYIQLRRGPPDDEQGNARNM